MAENRLPDRDGPKPVELVFDPFVVDWVCRELDIHPSHPEAIGISWGGQLIAGVIYSGYRPRDSAVEMSIYSTSPRWATRRVLRAVFGYPFTQLNLKRVEAVTRDDNHAAQRLLDRLGFTREGVLRSGYQGRDGYIYGMLSDECRWT